jgi:hypothetical protein
MRILAAILMLLVLVPASFAFTVTVPVETIKVKAIAETSIPISIMSNIADTLTATIQDAKPWMGLSESQFTIEARTVKNITLTVAPFSDVILGMYGIPIVFTSVSTREEKKATVFINIERGDVLNIERMSVTGSLNPLGSAHVQVDVKNYKPVSVEGVTVFMRVTSPTNAILNEFTRTLPRLDPDQTQAADFSIFFDKNAPAGSYEVYSKVTYLDEKDEYRQTFNLQSKPIIQRETSRAPTLFGFEKKIILTNNGNAVGEEVVTDYLSPIETAFFSGDSPTLKSSGVYTWVVRNIQPGETRYIVYRIDYSPLFLFVIALIIAGWIFFFKLKTVRIKKYIMHKKKIEAGEEFTIAVEVINKLGGKMDVVVNDFVPAVFDVKETEGPKPVKKKGHAGAELSWHVNGLHMNEARILTYKIIPVFGVHGILKLSKASVSFKWRNRLLKNHSGSPALGISAESAEESIAKLIKRKK